MSRAMRRSLIPFRVYVARCDSSGGFLSSPKRLSGDLDIFVLLAVSRSSVFTIHLIPNCKFYPGRGLVILSDRRLVKNRSIMLEVIVVKTECVENLGLITVQSSHISEICAARDCASA
jgi:hypothetical protein